MNKVLCLALMTVSALASGCVQEGGKAASAPANLVAAPASVAAAPAPTPPPAPAEVRTASVAGTNMGPLAYYSSAVSLIDLRKSSGAWLTQRSGKWDTKEPLDLDEQGYARSLPRDESGTPASLGLILLDGVGSAAPPARYVVLYEGEGTMQGMVNVGSKTVQSEPGRLLVETTRDGALHLKITATDPRGTGDYIRNIRVVREDHLAAYQQGRMFNPAFLDKLRGFHVIRFMDWMGTNRLFRSDGTQLHYSSGWDPLSTGELQWEGRPRLDDARWVEGVPVEAMVQLANEIDADPWFTMPINASDDYVRGFAQYVRQHLEPGLKVHVELSNEVWNWSFPQAAYAKKSAEKEFGPDAKWLEWYGKRSAEVGAIWNEVFGEPATGTGDPGRVIVVFGTQFAWQGLESYGLETTRWKDAEGNAIRAADYFDQYAVAPYYTGGMEEPKNVDTVIGWWSEPDGGFQRALDTLKQSIEEKNRPRFAYHGEVARRYGLEMVTYEASYGALTPPSQHGNQKYTDFLIELGRRPEIHDLDLANVKAFHDAGGTLYVNYGFIGKPSKWGSWSLLESVDQESSPRYRAMRTLLETHQP